MISRRSKMSDHAFTVTITDNHNGGTLLITSIIISSKKTLQFHGKFNSSTLKWVNIYTLEVLHSFHGGVCNIIYPTTGNSDHMAHH